MRTIIDHKIKGLNEAIEITVRDEPGPGGANHCYSIHFPRGTDVPRATTEIVFQHGPIATPQDFNGLTNEALLAVLIDRMRGFQYQRAADGTFIRSARGQFACRENAIALTHLEFALMWLHLRTRDRMARNVKGKNLP